MIAYRLYVSSEQSVSKYPFYIQVTALNDVALRWLVFREYGVREFSIVSQVNVN